MVLSWLVGLPRRVAAGVLGWISDNPLRVAGGIAALLAAGRLYGIARDALRGPAVAPEAQLPALAVDLAIAHPAYVLATVLGTVAVVTLRS
ncbi:hypothetical protein ACFQPA_14020 [Halomarina halobia]|uniref:Uncharacterized protein n=1 Tax=Halomarina halobia TaxID=3033386 RepID=A0ABD6A9K1_9EURY|nr:hypothetical protein [Halomarina sp. PSR21]